MLNTDTQLDVQGVNQSGWSPTSEEDIMSNADQGWRRSYPRQIEAKRSWDVPRIGWTRRLQR